MNDDGGRLFPIYPSSFLLHSSAASCGDHAVGVDDELFGGAFVEVLVALGGVVEGDGGDVDGFGDLDLVVEDALHQGAVVLHDGALAGVERVALGPAQAD